MFQINKNIPNRIDDSYFHQDTIEILKTISSDESMPHMMFTGPKGSGKKTLANLFLKKMYGDDVNDLKTITYEINGNCNKVIDIEIQQSNYHIIITPNNNNFDKYVIQTIIKKYAKLKSFDFFKKRHNFRVIFITNLDSLPYYAQTSLRRTMEKYSKKCRFILCTDSLTKIIDPLISRCMVINLSKPTEKELHKFIDNILSKEKIMLSKANIKDIIGCSDCNIKKILWVLETFFIRIKLLKYNNYADEPLEKLNEKDRINLITDIVCKENIVCGKKDFDGLLKCKPEDFCYELFKFIESETLNITYNKKIEHIVQLLLEINYEHIKNNIWTLNVANDIKDNIINALLRLDNVEITNNNKKNINDIKNNSNNLKDFTTQITNKIKGKFVAKEDKVIEMYSKFILNFNCDKIKDLLYTLFVSNISFVDVLRDIVDKLLDQDCINEEQKFEILYKSTIISHNLVKARRDIIHMDDFVNSVIKIINVPVTKK